MAPKSTAPPDKRIEDLEPTKLENDVPPIEQPTIDEPVEDAVPAFDDATLEQDREEPVEAPPEPEEAPAELQQATTEQPEAAIGAIEGGWSYVYAAYGVTWAFLAGYVIYLVVYRRIQSVGGDT